MRIVSIDSSLGCQLLVCDLPTPVAGQPLAPQVLIQLQEENSRRHAESLGSMLAHALADPTVAAQPLDAVVVATGPAPFTGLRAGLVTARTLGFTLGIPVYGVPSLDAVARLALDDLARAQAPAEAIVKVVTEARRKELYTACYRAKGSDDVERVSDFAVLPPSAISGSDVVYALAGSGTALYPDLAAQAPRVLAPVSGDALTQVRVAQARCAAGLDAAQQRPEPLYLRHADVHVPAASKNHI